MSASIITALTPNQVNDELNKMQAFIRKEAEEKAREIKLKADQEYEIEKTSIVRNETNNIDINYNNKLKKASLKQQINKSTIDNKMRLKVLTARDESLVEIFDETKKQLAQSVSSDKNKYKTVLSELIMESLLRLLESSAVVKVKESDVEIAESLIDDLTKQYKEKTNMDIGITVSDEHLNKELIGGCVVSNAQGKIELNNTLDERLVLLNEEALPAIRLEMFGITKTRKFFD